MFLMSPGMQMAHCDFGLGEEEDPIFDPTWSSDLGWFLGFLWFDTTGRLSASRIFGCAVFARDVRVMSQ